MRNIYDFDGTIFEGDSTARFCFFALWRQRGLARGLFRVARGFIRMARGRISKTQAKEGLYRALLVPMRDVDKMVDDFWARDFARIKNWYIEQRAASDLIISASPEFLLRPVCEKLGVELIASRVNKRTGEYQGLNCDGWEKVARYRAQCPAEPFEFYSDALIDAPMAVLAKRAWLVKGNKITPWPCDKTQAR